ncbi:T9SS type A sorting domain-containing protein [Candidatus Latescibacterota bacterium]
MNRTATSIACAVIAAMAASGVLADVSVAGAIQVVTPPEDLTLNAYENSDSIRVFRERDGYTLPADLKVNFLAWPGTYTNYGPEPLSPMIIPAGTVINSYFLHADPVGTASATLSGSLIFDEMILGVILQAHLLNASDGLGVAGTVYPREDGLRGAIREATDSGRATVGPDRQRMDIGFYVSAGGRVDEVRVITTDWAVPFTRSSFAATAGDDIGTWVGEPVPLEVELVLRPPLEETGVLRQMVVDLTPLGVANSLPVAHAGDGRYTLDEVIVPLRPGRHDLPLLLETMDGVPYHYLSIPLTVWPLAEVEVFGDSPGPGWELTHDKVEGVNVRDTREVYSGDAALSVVGKASFSGWGVAFRPPTPVDVVVYRALRFALRLDDVDLSGSKRFSVIVAPGRGVNLVDWVDMGRKEWQVVEIPLGLFNVNGPVESISISGNFGGLFCLDEMELTLWPEDVEDLVILGDALAPRWEVSGSNVERLEPAQTDVVHAGSAACAVRGEESAFWWSVEFQAADPVYPLDYETLRFAFHPGDLTQSVNKRLNVAIPPGIGLNLLNRVDLARKEWQLVEFSLVDFGLEELIESVSFSGNLEGVFYLDDLALVPRLKLPPRPATAVVEERTAPVPGGFALDQNYPNPFNSSTVIQLDLPEPEVVRLMLYNVAGQRVSTLIQGSREAGRYTVRWDARDDDGRELASGVYLYRLVAGNQVQTRKLLLLR